jgi:spore maturation protein CgeD
MGSRGWSVKISVILASYNRPQWVRQAIRSIVNQTHKDYQAIVVDESDAFDIHEVVKEFKLTETVVMQYSVSPEQRAVTNRLGININLGLSAAKGDLVCYLGDDDYYYPNWFADAAAFFSEHGNVGAGFGKLVYSNSREMVFPTDPAPVNLRFFNEIVMEPFDRIDHNQGIHRRFDPPIRWTEDPGAVGGPDAYYWRDVARQYPFHPIPVFAAVKRVHKKNLQSNLPGYYSGKLEHIRE